MGTAVNALARAIAAEALSRARDSNKPVAEIAAELALAGWKPVDIATSECREIVAGHYQRVRHDAQRAEQFRSGVCDHHHEMIQATSAFRRATELSAAWLDEQATENRTGVRMLTAMECVT
jgi:hypothetical protein